MGSLLNKESKSSRESEKVSLYGNTSILGHFAPKSVYSYSIPMTSWSTQNTQLVHQPNQQECISFRLFAVQTVYPTTWFVLFDVRCVYFRGGGRPL